MNNICSVCKKSSFASLHKGYMCQSCKRYVCYLMEELGYEKEEAILKASYGKSTEGKISYWTMRYKKEQDEKVNRTTTNND